jgi:hypothetical protein
MGRRLLVAFAVFTAAQLAGAAVFDLIDGAERIAAGTLPEAWGIVPWIPTVLAPIWAGWRVHALAEVALLGPCGALAYLAFLALSGQLFGEPDPSDGSAFLLIDVALFGFGALILSALAWLARGTWRRVRDRDA